MIYAPSDVQSITAPGGCGQPHSKTDPDQPFTVECAPCEPQIIGLKLGWGYAPHQVAPTCDELAIAEAADQQAKRQQNLAWGSPDTIAKSFAAAMQQPAQPKSLLEQLAALGPEDRAAVRAMLGDGHKPTDPQITVEYTPRLAQTPPAETPAVPAPADSPPAASAQESKPAAKKTTVKKTAAAKPTAPSTSGE